MVLHVWRWHKKMSAEKVVFWLLIRESKCRIFTYVVCAECRGWHFASELRTKRNNICIMKTIFRGSGNGKVWSHPTSWWSSSSSVFVCVRRHQPISTFVHTAPFRTCSQCRTNETFPLMPPIYMQNTQPESNVFGTFVVRTLTTHSKDDGNDEDDNGGGGDRKCIEQNPFIKILRDDYETAYTRHYTLFRELFVSKIVKRRDDVTLHDRVNSIDWNSLQSINDTLVFSVSLTVFVCEWVVCMCVCVWTAEALREKQIKKNKVCVCSGSRRVCIVERPKGIRRKTRTKHTTTKPKHGTTTLPNTLVALSLAIRLC